MDAPRKSDSDIDWGEARRFLRLRLAGDLDAQEQHELDDLVQEACVRLLRAVRREGARDLPSLMAVVARRTRADFIRRRVRARKLWSTLPDSTADVNARGQELVDPHGIADHFRGELQLRLELIVLELFEREGASDCAALARAFFAEHEWPEVARQLGTSHDAVRKRWSRCLEVPRRALAADPQWRRWLWLETDSLRG